MLFRSEVTGDCTGIDGCDEQIAIRAIDLLAERSRLHRRGVPTAPETVLLDVVLQEGSSLPWKAEVGVCERLSASGVDNV